ncbi:Rhamnogalacturonan acetylesterase RhgT [Colletotrichum shisoi]|uniref:Rhamnogalacturonan acetylesterase RhgT n=1 Tax=Colletotrichum shisoi TaxID=2078593 RepID=A0A5Q4BQX0_9PEZI|nr:Rhamnogalacturonan acetylesterase RhgT [Colletotrichum shisoi]
MKPQSLFSAAAAVLLPTLVAAAPAEPAEERAAAKPPAFFLAGDSTTAVQATGGGGWGNGFLSFLKKPAFGTNYGRNGRTTVDYVSQGHWDTVKSAVKSNTASFDVYVTIQFGHNDQKPEKNISLDQYQSNLVNLSNERERTIAAAAAGKTTYVDLNLYSRKFVQAIGETKAHSYNLQEDDNTHLNDEGSVVFGRLVADLLLEKEKKLEQWFTPNKSLSDEIWKAINSSSV